MPRGTPIGAPLTQAVAGSSDGIVSLAFDVRGRVIATGSSDGKIQLWDLDTAAPIGSALPADGWISQLTYAASGRLVSSVIGPGPAVVRPVVIWRLDPATLERTACERANRLLTPTEWSQLVGNARPFRAPCVSLSG